MIRSDAGPRAGEQCSGETRADMHHGAKKSACRNTPPVKCATLKTSDNASIPIFLPRSGVSVRSSGGPVMDPRPPVDLQMAASADHSSNSSAHYSGKEIDNECDQQNLW